MDVNFINPFLEATINVIKTMASLDIVLGGPPALKKDDIAIGDVTGIIGLTGENQGSLSVSFNFRLIQNIMANMLKEKIEEITNEVRDAVGELTNMISSDARSKLQAKLGLDIRAAIPTIVSGEGHAVKHVLSGPVIVIPFKAEGSGQLTVEVSIQKSTNGGDMNNDEVKQL